MSTLQVVNKKVDLSTFYPRLIIFTFNKLRVDIEQRAVDVLKYIYLNE